MIYTHVCGDSFLHISERPPIQATTFLGDGDLIHIVPPRPIAPKPAIPVRFEATICYAYTEGEDQNLDGLFTKAYGSPHAQYDDGWWVCGNIRARLLHVPYRLDLRFLLVSRRVYDEARHIPYTSNTFSFNKVRLLTGLREHFLRSATGNHLALVGIHFDIRVCHWDDLTRWKMEIQQCVRDFPRLRHVGIDLCLNCGQSMPPPSRPPKIGVDEAQDPGPIMSTFLQLRRLPLQSIYFQMSDRCIWRKLGDEAKAQANAEMQEWSHYIRDKLLQKAA